MVKNLFLFFTGFLIYAPLFGQQDSSSVIKKQYHIQICDTLRGLPQNIIYGNSTPYSQFIFADKNIENIFKDYEVYFFKRLYPSYTSPFLNQFYTIRCTDTTSTFVRRLKNYDSSIYCMWRRVYKPIFPEGSSSIKELDKQNIYITKDFYPNPTRNGGEIDIYLTETSDVKLTVSNLLGQTMTTQNLGKTAPGNTTIKVNTENFASGVYMYTISTDTYSVSGKMIVNK